jgi:hypothetical protein
MNANSQNPSAASGAIHAAGCDAEETLRLIANLPVPEDLEDRIHAVLRSAPHRGALLAWPSPAAASGWMRGVAAAAIAFLIAGGGWGIYSRVQPAQPAQGVVMPLPVQSSGGFSSAGAIRTPQRLNGPVLTHPLKPLAATGKAAKKKPAVHGQRPSGVSGKAAQATPVQ